MTGSDPVPGFRAGPGHQPYEINVREQARTNGPALDADQGRPALATRAIPEYVAAYEKPAEAVPRRLT